MLQYCEQRFPHDFISMMSVKTFAKEAINYLQDIGRQISIIKLVIESHKNVFKLELRENNLALMGCFNCKC